MIKRDIRSRVDTSYLRRGYPAAGYGLNVALWTLAAVTNDTLNGEIGANYWRLKELAATPAAPSAGYYKLYMLSDGKGYMQDSAGNEVSLSGGVGGQDIIRIRVFTR